MNEDLDIDDFENWLKNQADKHRMYPSDRLWRNISEEIHEHSRWPALTFSAILIGALVTATLIFLHPNKDLVLRSSAPNYTTIANNTVPTNAVSDTYSAKQVQKESNNKFKPVSEKEAIYSFNYTVNTTAENKENNKDVAHNTLAATSNPILSPLTENETPVLEASVPQSGHGTNIAKIASSFSRTKLLANNEEPAADIVTADAVSANNETKKESAIADIAEDLDQQSDFSKKHISLPDSRKTRWNVEFYGGSNISYRRLSEPYAYSSHTGGFNPPTPAGSSDVNSVVKQKPSVGFNLGAAFTYALGKRVKVKAGLQFNYRQFNIDAYKSQYERSVLLLNNGFFYPDSVYMYSVISNEKGRAITLNNRYYQVGIPVSLEWTVAKSSNLSFNLAASVQPTYQLNSNVYLLTSDYKSYVQAPDLLRRININAGAEATIAFSAGGVKWQAGPQLLYQTLPTQKGNYSIREHLFDYGIRVGMVKQLH